MKAVETATDFLPMSKSQGLPSRFSVNAAYTAKASQLNVSRNVIFDRQGWVWRN
ncbi:hypothetical protein [Microcoleus sp. AR_TQ3_B6]|uniref:hypothetical protein n=1 Tax=Microcoleus sp. AR_TQ3_B6 TaxID=3055284 RepID=UPI002FD597FA